MRKLMLVVVLATLAGRAAGQEVTLRHAFAGRALDALATLVVKFNDEQKGKAKVVLEDLAGVAEPRRLPHMAVLDDDDAGTFFAGKPRFLPLAEIMKVGGQALDGRVFFPQIADAVDDARGMPQGLPIALALPVLFYNKDAFIRAGLDPDQPPKTWWEVQKAAGQLHDAGIACPLTTSRFAWIHLENLSSQHAEPMTVRGGQGRHFFFNSMVHVKHVALLSSWYKSSYFRYFGPGREGDGKFAGGECAMLTGESALYAELAERPRFAVGVAALPYYEDVYGSRPGEITPDGAALWFLAGARKEEYRVMARFVAFLMRPELQRQWVRATGFLPMTPAAIDALREAGVSPAVLEQARKRLSMPRKAEARTRAGSGRDRLRGILNEEIEFVWRNTKPAKEALDTAMRRANPVPVAAK